jgi:hypothetical protein
MWYAGSSSWDIGGSADDFSSDMVFLTACCWSRRKEKAC